VACQNSADLTESSSQSSVSCCEISPDSTWEEGSTKAKTESAEFCTISKLDARPVFLSAGFESVAQPSS
jgi:hypothetical protein